MAREEEQLASRKMRIAASPALLQSGFRPFFLGGAAWAIAALALWLAALLGGLRFFPATTSRAATRPSTM